MSSYTHIDTRKDYYRVLGIFAGSSPQAIKAAYRKLAQQYHPDKNAGNVEAEQLFVSISEAYDVLSDPGQRDYYDRARNHVAASENPSGENALYATYGEAAAQHSEDRKRVHLLTLLRQAAAEGKKPDLRGMELSQSDLTALDLSGCDVSGADFSNAMLTDTDFSRCLMEGTVLDGALMNRTRFVNTDLSSCIFSPGFQNMRGADLTQATIMAGSLRGFDLTHARLKGMRVRGPVFKEIIPYATINNQGETIFILHDDPVAQS